MTRSNNGRPRDGMRMPPPMTMQSQRWASDVAIVASALSSARIEQKPASQPRAFMSDSVASIPAAIFSCVIPGGGSGSETSTASGLMPNQKHARHVSASFYAVAKSLRLRRLPRRSSGDPRSGVSYLRISH